MRSMVLLLLFQVTAGPAPPSSVELTFEDVSGRRLESPERLAEVAELGRRATDLAQVGAFAREGPTIDADIGTRDEAGTRRGQASARVELPVLRGRGARAAADQDLQAASADILAAAAMRSHLELRAAFLDSWLAQERLAVLGERVSGADRVLASVRRRVEEGAEAPYELAILEGELLRFRGETDAARAQRGEAWSRLRRLADLPPDPVPLVAPGRPDLALAPDLPPRFESGVLYRSVTRHRSLDLAFLDLQQAQRRSRWGLAGELGKEGEEEYALVGASYRFPRRGESRALQQERDAAALALTRDSEAEVARLQTLFRTALDRAQHFGEITDPVVFDEARRAIELRMQLGKERPSQALLLLKQVLEARDGALQRIHEAHLLRANIDALTMETAP